METTGKSYEEQLSLMSEHLAAMNEKLSQQKDEIDALKFELTNKVDITLAIILGICIVINANCIMFRNYICCRIPRRVS